MPLVAPGTLVFVIDDDVEVRHSIAECLIVEGYEARALASAEAAWFEITCGARPAAIVLDLWLAGAMSSGEFVRRLRASGAAEVPILVLSGSRAVAQIESDVDAVTHKPVEATALVRALDDLVRRSGSVAMVRQTARAVTARPASVRRSARRRRPRHA
jgi:DNA-binding response OmpR family regulator